MESLHKNNGKDTVNTCFIITCILFGLLSSSKESPTSTRRNYSFKSYFSNRNITKEYEKQIKDNFTLNWITHLPINANSLEEKQLTTNSQNSSDKLTKDSYEKIIKMLHNDSGPSIQEGQGEKYNDFLLIRNGFTHFKKRQKNQYFNTDNGSSIHIEKTKSYINSRYSTTRNLYENSLRTIMKLDGRIKIPNNSVVLFDKLPFSEKLPTINNKCHAITDFNRIVEIKSITYHSNSSETNIKSFKNYIEPDLKNSENMINEIYYNNGRTHPNQFNTLHNHKINESTTGMIAMDRFDNESSTIPSYRDSAYQDDDYVICRGSERTHRCSKYSEGCAISRLITIILSFIVTVLALAGVCILIWNSFKKVVPRDRCIECRLREREED